MEKGMMDYITYSEKLGIGFDDDRKFTMFCNIMNNEYHRLQLDSKALVIEEQYQKYCNAIGYKIIFDDYYYGNSPREILSLFVKTLDHERSVRGYLAKYVTMLNIVTDGNSKRALKAVLVKSLTTAHIDYEIVTDNYGEYFFPKGAPELDKPLVTDVLNWLGDYPVACSQYVTALKSYANKEDKAIVADNFRKALEQFFKEFFKTEKSLENVKTRYGEYLKSAGIHQEIITGLTTSLNAYIHYMNEHAKHGTDASSVEIEYVMYQTGIIIREVIVAKRELDKGLYT